MQTALERELSEIAGRRKQLLISTPMWGSPPFLAEVIRELSQRFPECVLHFHERPEHLSLPELQKYDLNISMDVLHPELEQLALQFTSSEAGEVPAFHLYIAQESLIRRVWGNHYDEYASRLHENHEMELLNEVPFIQFTEPSVAAALNQQLVETQFRPRIIACVDNSDLNYSH